MVNNFTSAAISLRHFVFLVLGLVACSFANAQYFGRNKLNYEKYPFKELRSPHFKLYNYLGSKEEGTKIALQMEQWYKMHQQVLSDTFTQPNPVILYNNHADFQQTNAVSGLIDVGTGGVTEGLKDRVIFPVMASNAQTDHVMGHELVHAFQYHLLKTSDSLSLRSIGNLPLWMVEGMAEYMSIGFIDSHTAIWLRSAILNNKLPTLKDMVKKPDEYFPYRWGEAFWAYLTARYGDTIIKPLFMRSGSIGFDDAIKQLTGKDSKTISEDWKNSLIQFYTPLQTGQSLKPSGKKLIGNDRAGETNIVPTLSPDGKLIAFWTLKNLFSFDLYLANAATGEIGKRITTNALNTHVDQYSSFESTIAWSPDSKQFAFVSFAKGRNQLLIADVNGEISKRIFIQDLQSFSNPAWSPDGKSIVISGLVNGRQDLYLYSLDDQKLTPLTDNYFSEIEPSWSPDGKWITYATDRPSYRNEKFPHYFSHQIALLNIQDKTERILPFFVGANNLNPIFSPDGKSLFFLSDRDGFRNLYQYDVETGSIFQNTNFFTGITGITRFAPAISISALSGTIAYSYYDDDNYSIYTIPVRDLSKKKSSLMPLIYLRQIFQSLEEIRPLL